MQDRVLGYLAIVFHIHNMFKSKLIRKIRNLHRKLMKFNFNEVTAWACIQFQKKNTPFVIILVLNSVKLAINRYDNFFRFVSYSH